MHVDAPPVGGGGRQQAQRVVERDGRDRRPDDRVAGRQFHGEPILLLSGRRRRSTTFHRKATVAGAALRGQWSCTRLTQPRGPHRTRPSQTGPRATAAPPDATTVSRPSGHRRGARAERQGSRSERSIGLTVARRVRTGLRGRQSPDRGGVTWRPQGAPCSPIRRPPTARRRGVKRATYRHRGSGRPADPGPPGDPRRGTSGRTEASRHASAGLPVHRGPGGRGGADRRAGRRRTAGRRIGRRWWSVTFIAAQFNAPGDDARNLNGEWVTIKNSCATTVSIYGWKIRDRDLHTSRIQSWPKDLTGGGDQGPHRQGGGHRKPRLPGSGLPALDQCVLGTAPTSTTPRVHACRSGPGRRSRRRRRHPRPRRPPTRGPCRS